MNIHLPISVSSGNLKKSNNGAIKRAIELVNWNFIFSHKNVHEQVFIFNYILMNIFPNYIPNKLITVDDKDPLWMNEYIKKKDIGQCILYIVPIHKKGDK